MTELIVMGCKRKLDLCRMYLEGRDIYEESLAARELGSMNEFNDCRHGPVGEGVVTMLPSSVEERARLVRWLR